MPETLYLIDGFAQIFRAYYAIRGGMRSPVTSEPTHAVFGFTGMLLKLLQQLEPSHVAVALDVPGKTFRDELYADYKGTRGATPDDLTSQIPRILELIELFGIPTVGHPGLEADDVIACITHRVLSDPLLSDMTIRIVSKDKDLEQLLCERVSLFDIHTDTTIDVPALMANKGITPAQVIDYLALIGDTVDNVPGVEGIGPKTASQLIQQFGSIDGIYAALDQIPGKKRESLEKAKDHIALSRTLVTLQCESDFLFDLESARTRPLNVQPIIPFFQQLGFNRYQDEVKKLAGESPAPSLSARDSKADESVSESAIPGAHSPLVEAPREQGRYECIRTSAQLNSVIDSLRSAPMIAVDTETTGLGRDSLLCGLSLAWKEGHGVYVPIRSPEPGSHLDESEVIAALRPILEDPNLPKCGHNLKFDTLALMRAGVHLRGVAFDSMLASALINPGESAHKLDFLAESVLGHRMIPITDLIGEGKELSMADAPLEKITPYAAEDADVALRLYHAMLPKVEEMGMGLLLREVESCLTVVLAEMESNGILCDPEELKRQGVVLGDRVEELRRQIFEAAGFEFHIDSTKQLAEALFDKLGLAEQKKTKTGRSTDIEVLEKLAAMENRGDPRTCVPRLVIEYRQLQKLIGTYLGNLQAAIHPTTGRIHSTFHQLVTATGRLASHNPNLQNIPVRTDVGRLIRKAFLAPPGYRLICADYSQIELRVLAHFSEDAALLEAFANGEDIHTAVASQVFGVEPSLVSREMRNRAKTINFGIIYGVTPFGLARRIEGLDVSSATRLISDYKAKFPGIDQFLQECIRQAMDQGWVSTILGRRRAIPEIYSTNRGHRALGERLAINSVVQGSAADLIKTAMVRVQNRIDRDRLPMKLLLQIHDELVLESPEELAQNHAEIVRTEMEQAMTLRVPLQAEAGIGVDWMSAK